MASVGEADNNAPMVNKRALRAARILLVESDDRFRALIGASLRHEGHLVAEAQDTLDALRTVMRDPPDLLVLDAEADPYVILERLSVLPQMTGVPIIALGGDADLLRLASAGVIEHLRKPFGYSELHAVVDAVLSLTPEEISVERELVRAFAGDLALA